MLVASERPRQRPKQQERLIWTVELSEHPGLFSSVSGVDARSRARSILTCAKSGHRRDLRQALQQRGHTALKEV